MNPTLTVDDLAFEVRRSARRKTLEITVDRGGELILSAPETCDETVMADFVRKKRFWIYTKLAEKERLQKPQAAKELSLIHISEPTRRTPISYAVFCLKKKKTT